MPPICHQLSHRECFNYLFHLFLIADNDMVSNWAARILQQTFPRYEGGVLGSANAKWCLIVDVEVGVVCTGGAGGVYCVEGGGGASTEWNGPCT